MAGNANRDTVPVAFWMGSVQDERFTKLLTLICSVFMLRPPGVSGTMFLRHLKLGYHVVAVSFVYLIICF